jgi:hypothetical protein
MKALAAKIIELVDIDFPVTVGVHCGPDERGLIRRDVARFLQRPHEQHTVLQYMLPWEVLIPELTPLPVIDTGGRIMAPAFIVLAVRIGWRCGVHKGS